MESIFPHHVPPTPYAKPKEEPIEGVRIANAELLVIAKRPKIKKAPGPDGIPNITVSRHGQVKTTKVLRSQMEGSQVGAATETWKVTGDQDRIDRYACRISQGKNDGGCNSGSHRKCREGVQENAER